MWKWYSADETSPAGGPSPDQESAGTMSVADLTEQLAQTEQLVVQLKELIREKDNELRKKDQQLKEEKETLESKVSKAKLQSKAKVASLSSQLEELKKQLASSNAPEIKADRKKGSGDSEQESASANRGKILLLRKRVEELESQLSAKNEDIQRKEAELESQRLRGSELDTMLAEKQKKLAEKEAYIIDLQVSAGANLSKEAFHPEENIKNQVTQKDSSQEDLQLLIQNLTRKVGDSEERCSLLQEQAESLKSLLQKERSHFQEREAMYMENIRVFQGITQTKEKELQDQAQKHEQEVFKLLAKSDASADLHQLLKALKQKLHEEEEVLSGKNQVIDVLQKELDNKEHECKEISEKCKRLQSEKENLQSKLDAEKHVMRAQLRDLMEKHNTELQGIKEKHQGEMQEKGQFVLHLQKQLQDLGSSGAARTGLVESSEEAILNLQEEVKLKTEEASKSEAKFLKMKAWSKSKIRQLEEELKTVQFEIKQQDISVLNSRVCELENEKRELLAKLHSVSDLQSLNEELLAKLVIYEEQQRKMQADLEQVTKRADSQTSESGSVDELHNQLLEWNEMTPETEGRHVQGTTEKSILALRMEQMEEDREAMDSGQQELEEELNAARGMVKMRQSRRKGSKGSTKLQDEFDFSRKSFEDQNTTLESVDSAEGENMGGLRIVVEELEIERNQLQEQIMTLEERCQELEDRLQLQARIESLQSENERLQVQLTQLRQLHSRETEKHHDLVSTINQQLKGLTDRNAFLENAIVEKEQIILEATGKLEQMGTIKKSLQDKEVVNKDLSEKLEQTEQKLVEVTKKQIATAAENAALKESNGELEKKVSAYKERVLKQDAALEKLQLDLEQTNEELDRLNTSHLEERSQLILDLQRCEREMDVLKEVLQDKDKELSSLSASLTEYAEQVGILKEQIYFKEEQMREMSEALVKADRENYLLREAETSDVQETNARISSLSQQLHEMEGELIKAKHLNEGKTKEAEELIVQINENGTTIKNLRLEIQAQSVKHNNHVTECSTQIASLKEQINTSIAKCEEMEKSHRKEMERLRSQLEEDRSERAKLAGLLEEKNSTEQKVEKELKLAKEQYNQVISRISRKDEDLEQLSKELAEQRELREQVSKELQCKQEELSTLQRKLETVIQRSEEELKALQENAQELQTRIRDQSDMINKLDVDKNELCAQNQQLQDASAQKEQQLTAQVNTVEELKQSLHDLEEKHQLLCSEKEELRKNLSCIESEMSSLSQAVQEAQRKVTTAEQLLAEEQQAASTLVREKEELLQQVTVLTEQSLQKDKLVHEQLEERANECLGLQTSLTEEQELSQGLKLQIKSLEDQLKETQQGTQDKEDALQAKVAECTAVSQDLNQYKEKYSVLHKEIEALQEDVEKKKRALQEKDLVITTQNAHAEEASASMSKLQHEEHNLREVNVRLTKQVEEVTSALVSHRAEQERLQQELGHKLAENNILNGTLEILTREAEALKQEKAETLLLVSKSEEQRDGLQSQLLQKQSEADLLKQQIEILKGENEKLNSSCELTNTALVSKSEEIHILSSHLSQQGHKMLSLKDQIDTLLVEKQALVCNVEEKDALLRQKEELIQQTEKKLEGEGHYLQTISTMQNELQHVATERNRLQQLVDDKELEIRQLGQNLKMFRDKSEEAALLKTQLAEHVEIISDLHSQIKMLRENTEALNITGTEREESLKQMLEEYVHLQAQFSEVQGSFHAQKIQIEKLISENEHYKTVINDKDVALQKSSLNYADLKQQEQSKASQCADLMQQVTQLETTSANLNRELNELKVVFKGQEASLSEREALLISHLEARSLLVTGLEARVQELTSTLKHIEQTSTEKEITIHNLQDKYASLYDQKSELDQSLSRKEEELTRLVHSVREKDVSLMVSEKNVQALTNEIELLREELEKKSSNLNTLSITLKEKDDVNAVNQQAMQTMKAELNSLRVEYEKSVTQLHKVTEEIKEKELTLQSLQEKCNSQSQHVERLNAELNHLNVSSVQVQHDHLLHMEQLQLQLESTEQEKLRIEQASQEMRAQNERSAFELQKKLAEQAEIVKDQEAKLELLAKESAERMLSGTLQLETERADLQKQVSEKLEEICELKLKIEALGQDLAERQEETHRLKEQSESLSKHSHSLEQAMQGKENNIQALLKDLHFVEEQLGLLCDEDFPESSALHPHSDYQSNVERFSSLFSVALNHKSSLVELKQTLVTKESDCAERSQLLMSLESERALLQTELQKVKDDCYSLMEEIAAIRNTNAQQQCLLNEKEDVLSGVNALVAQLQEELRQSKDEFQQRLCAMEEGGTKMLELVEDIKRKDVIIQNLNVQLTQQKELISALSDQIKDKDASLAQVMESMSNEMLKISEERKMLNSELENAETAKRSCLLELEKVSAEFTECKIQLEEHQNMAAEKETAASRLQSEKDLMQRQVDKLGKEKDNLKRKLQAALVIRKELMQRMEKLEVSKQEELQSEQHSTEELRKTVDELNSKLNSVCSQKEEIDSHVQLVTKELQERERRADELDRALGDKERLVEELQNTILTLQCSLSQREDACQEHLRAIQEKDAHLQEVQDAMNERVKSLQEEILQLRENMENLRSHLQAAQEKIEDCVLESGHSDLDPTAQVDAVHLRQENTIVHNNVHGSLSCSDGSPNLTNQDQATLTERESLNINELEQLKVEHSYMLNMYEAKCKEYDLSLEQVQHLQQELLERESQLCNRDRKLEEQRMAMEGVLRQLQKMEQFENTVLDLKSLVQDQEFQLLQVNSERTNLLNECETLQAEIQKQSANFQSKLQEIQNLKTSVLQLEQYEKDKEMMTAEIILLQNNLETSKKELESIQRTAQQMSLDKETYVEALRMDQIESEKLRHELKLSNLVLLEREKTIAHLQDSLQKMTAVSEEESRTLNSRLADSREEADKLKSALDRLKEETEESAGKLGKANVEISNLKTKLVDSGKEEALALQQSSAPTHKNRAEIESQQGTVHQVTAVCESCSKKERVIVELENQVMQTNKTMRELREKHIKDAKEQENRQTEESSSKEQLQRKLQAALLSRKDILKENKSLKQKVDSLSVETDALKLSLHELQEQKNAEISALEQTKENILSENARLVMVNENLSAACESLKSTMETIVQEKEAFSFQLNSLKDSQTVELSGWKAKHGELNKEYESLLQAYENISDEIDKMRQVIESTKKEKYEILQRFHEAQAENTKLRTQAEENNQERDALSSSLESRAKETQLLQSEAERLSDLLKSSTEEQYLTDEESRQNTQLMEQNCQLQENCESLKMLLENEKENHAQLITEATQDIKSKMDMYKSEAENKISDLRSEKELLSSKLAELSRELMESKKQLGDSSAERSDILERLGNIELALKQEKRALMERESDLNKMHLENMSLIEKVKILEDDKSLLQEEIENVQEQFYKVKNEREHLGTELLDAVKKNEQLIDKFKSLQVQTNFLSQQVESLRAEKNSIMRDKEDERLQILREFEARAKSAQNDTSGTRSKSRELQELLKEKQQEINQLQRDSIKFQELILDLEGSVKDSRTQNASLQVELEKARKDTQSLNKELSANRRLLEMSKDDIRVLTSELKASPNVDITDRKQNLLPALAESEMLPSRAKPGFKDDSQVINRETIKQKIHMQHESPIHNIGQSNGIPTSRLLERESVQGKENQSNNDLENKMRVMQKEIVKKEQDFQQLLLERERLRADLEKQLTISQHMKQVINNKDTEISVLISSKDGEISSYVAEIQEQYRKRAENHELQLSSLQAQKQRSEEDCRRTEAELRDFQTKYDKALNDKIQLSNEVEAFRKSMSSLQTDRDLLCTELKSVQHQHETVLGQKDAIILNVTSENHHLKQELRKLLNQTDDLNAENAMLGAQLLRYREDLNQVLSLKDNQLKELLRQKLDHIKNLEEEKCDLQKQNREVQNEIGLRKQAVEAAELENQKLTSKVRDQEALIAAINKDKMMSYSRKKKDSRAGIEGVQQQNVSDHNSSHVIERGYNMDSGEQDNDLLEKQVNTTEKNLARSYWDIYHENKELLSQNETFGKAMAALQNDRDALIEDFKVLQSRYASELKAETMRGDDLETQLQSFKSYICGVLKRNSLLNETLLSIDHHITLDELGAEVESLCSILSTRNLEVSQLSAECARYARQIDAFSKSMASLQHERERLVQQLRDAKQGSAATGIALSGNDSTMSRTQAYSDTVTPASESSSGVEFSKLRVKVEELEKMLQQARSLQDAAERETSSYQCELTELRSEKNLLVTETQALRHQLSDRLAEKDRQIAELYKTQQEAVTRNLYGAQNMERMALVGSPGFSENPKSRLDEQSPQKAEIQRYLQEIHQRDLVIQQINSKAMESVEINAVLSAQLKTVSQGLKDTQMKYSDLQNQYYKLQRNCQSTQESDLRAIRAEVPPSAPQERANVLVDIDNAELNDLRTRLAETEHHYDSMQQELSHLSERLTEERTRREAAEEALTLAEQQSKRLEMKTLSREYEFALQMESDDERESLIIDPTQHVVVRKVRGGALTLRRWLRGRSLYCSKLLTSRGKSRYLFLTYLLLLHGLILMCLTGVL